MSTTHPPSRPPARKRMTPRRPDRSRALEGRILGRLNDALAATGAPAAFVARSLDIPIEAAAERLAGTEPIMVGELIKIANDLGVSPAMFFSE